MKKNIFIFISIILALFGQSFIQINLAGFESIEKKLIKQVKIRQALKSGLNKLDFDLKDDGFGDNVLFAAAMNGNMKLIKLLIDNGIDINIQDSQSGYTPLILALIQYHTSYELIKFMLDNGANPNIKSLESKTAYDIAIECLSSKDAESNEERHELYLGIVNLLKPTIKITE